MDNIGFEELKSDIHKRLLAQLDLEKLSTASNGRAKQAVATIIHDLVTKERLLLNATAMSDILVNGSDLVYIERGGVLQKIDVKFRDNRHLLQIIDRIVSAVGRRIDESSPMVDARLADGSRVNAIIPPLALDGPAL